LQGPDIPALPELRVFKRPVVGTKYVMGADPAEGNPGSNESAATVMDKNTGGQVALLAGRIEPSTFAFYIAQLSAYYFNAEVMVERNNHGHSVLLWLKDNYSKRIAQNGLDGRPGWLDSSLGKNMLYAECSDHFRTCAKAGTKVLHCLSTYTQLASIEGGSLRAPGSMLDDQADSFALANLARAYVRAPAQPARSREY
jgi:hypothetical protein